jgi:hypothetical protein
MSLWLIPGATSAGKEEEKKTGMVFIQFHTFNKFCCNFNYIALKAQTCTYTEFSLSDMLSDSVRASELSDCSSLSWRDTGLYEE